jgi:acetyl esterase/lipase
VTFSGTGSGSAGASAGVGVGVSVPYEGLWHDFQSHAGILDAADRALREIAKFVQSKERPATQGKMPSKT